jgi:hypothetical protein
MKQHFRFNRLKLRWLAGAAEEFLLVATIQNLRRLIRLRPPDILRPRGAATSRKTKPDEERLNPRPD